MTLDLHPPLAAEALVAFLATRAIPGLEEVVGGTYRRVLDLPGGLAVAELTPSGSGVQARFRLTSGPAADADAALAVRLCRRLFDLDADPGEIDARLGADPLLAPLVAATPGRRSPGHVDAHEIAVRAVIGQQVSVSGARTLCGRLVAEHGEPLPAPDGRLAHAFPRPAVIAALDPGALPMPRARGRALVGLSAALADGSVVIDPSLDHAAVRASLLALFGIGPWTADYIALRALADPDAFLPGDLGVRRAVEKMGLDGSPAALRALAECWRPYRAYAVHHLWASLHER